MQFRAVKDSVAQPLHRFGSLVARLPIGMGSSVFGGLGAMARAGYFLPGSHMSRAVGNFCRVTGRTDPWPVYSRMVDNIQATFLHFARLHRYGPAELVEHTVLDPAMEAECRRLAGLGRGLIVLVPHCAGAALSSARLNQFWPTVLLVREPRQPDRCQLMLDYLRKLGPEYILARNTPPATVMRQMVRALRENKMVVGTTDLVHSGPETIETQIFGQRIHSPGWPARLSERLGAPIVPGYIHMDGRQIRLLSDVGYVEPDIERSTQRWVDSFERFFRQYPSDWLFMLDKNWSRILADAAAPSLPSNLSPSTVS
jgi:lauroyl/myristoyl acyltransferase